VWVIGFLGSRNRYTPQGVVMCESWDALLRTADILQRRDGDIGQAKYTEKYLAKRVLIPMLPRYNIK
jgi:hypothetical protein